MKNQKTAAQSKETKTPTAKKTTPENKGKMATAKGTSGNKPAK